MASPEMGSNESRRRKRQLMSRVTEFHLPDGRALSFDDVGPRDGWPIFYCHGVPSARTEWHMWAAENLFRETRSRLVAVDRPGTGSSSFKPARRLADWPNDI